MTLALLIGAGIIILALAGAHQSWKAHTQRYGHIPVVFRWFTGRQRHGLEGDDRRYDDRYDPLSKHYHPAERWSRGIQRSCIVFSVPLLALAYTAHEARPAVWGFLLLFFAALNQVARLTIRGRLRWKKPGTVREVVRKPVILKDLRVAVEKKPRTAMVRPLHKKLAGIVGIPQSVKPGQWIRLIDENKGVHLTLPKNWNGSEADRNRIVATTRETMGMNTDTKPEWNLSADGPSSVLIRDQAPTPPHVSLKDIREYVDKAGQDSIVLGLGRGNQPVDASLKRDSPHFGLSIGAGGGKSQIARLCAAHVLHNGGIVLILDIKRISHAWARDLPNVRYARSVDEIHEALVWLGWEIDRRTEVADVGIDVEGEVLANVGPRLLVIAEELNETTARLRRLWAEGRAKTQSKKSPAIAALESAFFMGRQIKINMLAVAQMMTAIAAGSGAARENMGVRILGRYTRNNWRMLVPEFDMPARSLRPGRVQVVTSDCKECQVAFLTGAEARDLATSGTVTPWPAMPSGDIEPEDHVVAIPPSTVETIPTEVVEVTLQEAMDKGYTSKNKKQLQNARLRDPTFPNHIGQRLDQHGRPRTYDGHAIERWEKRRV